VTNEGPVPTTGVATFNVQPALAGAYFIKLECFCFTEKTLQPGETTESAVVFYVDPGLVQDPNVQDLNSMTLSYTYFPAKGGKPVAEATPSGQPAGPPAATSSTTVKTQ
jgi:cytochrome c oxidase assembly protein subunit 11